MQNRTISRVVPDAPPYVCIKLECGEHHFRVPSAIAGAKLLKAVDSSHIAALSTFDIQGDPMAIIGALRNSGPELLGLAGYVIGAAWFNQNVDLSTPLSLEDPLACGEAIIEELHEAGYRIADVVLCALVVLNEWMKATSINAEAAARLDFFARKPGSTTSGDSTSTSSSSAGGEGGLSTN